MCTVHETTFFALHKKIEIETAKKTATLKKKLLLSITNVFKQSKTIYNKNLVESRGYSDL